MHIAAAAAVVGGVVAVVMVTTLTDIVVVVVDVDVDVDFDAVAEIVAGDVDVAPVAFERFVLESCLWQDYPSTSDSTETRLERNGQESST